MTAAEQRPRGSLRLKVMMSGPARLLLAAGSALTLVACGSVAGLSSPLT